ncbi:unnamed protein product [Lupinus luteus]|uniref:Uncharacterized protein n=1 Tax=Lupinus luteus TaxID=3873 RepID=A0AAV1X2H4_LUPLU
MYRNKSLRWVEENYDSVPERFWFLERPIDTTPAADTVFHMTGSNIISVELWLMDNLDARSMIFMTALDELNATPLSERKSIFALFASALICVFPVLAPTVKLVLNNSGMNTREVKLPSQAEQHLIQMNRDTPENYVAVLGAQIAIMLIKNPSDANCNSFMQSWAQGLAASIGMPTDSRNFTPIADFEKVTLIKRLFSNRFLNTYIMKEIINYCALQAPISTLYNYVAEIVKYHGMGAFTSISDVLLSVKSPVLYNPRVLHEVDRFSFAYIAVRQFEYPQYFYMLAKPTVTHLIERNNFPVLARVAQLIKQATSSPLNPFVAPRDRDSPIVLELVELHKRAIFGRSVNVPRPTLRSLNAYSYGNMEVAFIHNSQSANREQSDRVTIQQPPPRLN